MKIVLILLSSLSLKISAAHVQVLIWEPNDRHKYGHAALQTNVYHMSFWPDGDVKNCYDDSGVTTRNRSLDVLFGGGVPGSLNFDESYDNYLEGEKDDKGKHLRSRRPEKIPLNNVPTRWIHQAYEELLGFNDITPDRVTREEGARISLGEEGVPSIGLTKTFWSLNGDITPYHFFEHQQSCATFSLNLLRWGGLNIDDSEVANYIGYNHSYRHRMLDIPSFKILINNHLRDTPDAHIRDQIASENGTEKKPVRTELKGILKPKTVRKRENK